jgi:hypothetical protein
MLLMSDYRYETYAKPVAETYDTVISNTMRLLRNYTLDERRRRIQVGMQDNQVIHWKLIHMDQGLWFNSLDCVVI